MTMMESALGFYEQNSSLPVPPRGERVAKYVDDYLAVHRGLSLGELSFRLRADKRDMQRLIRDRSCGPRLEDALAAYFGPDFCEAVFGPLWGDGPSIREREIERERAEIAARNAHLDRLWEARRTGRPADSPGLRVVPAEDDSLRPQAR